MTRYEDWSPASVFGATTSTRQERNGLCARTKANVREPQEDGERAETRMADSHAEMDGASYDGGEDRAEIASRARSSNNMNSDGALHIAEKDVYVGEYERRAQEQQNDMQRAHALCVLSKWLRVWILYRREVASMAVVGALRKRLQRTAATTIAHAFTRYRQRRAIAAYLLMERHRQEVKRGNAARVIAAWYRLHRLRALAKRERQRLGAVRIIVCWWRQHMLRIQVIKRRAQRHLARKRIGRVIFRYHHRHVTAAQVLQRAYRESVQRSMAKQERERLAQQRHGIQMLITAHRQIALWRRWSQWRDQYTQFKAEQQRQKNAAVLIRRSVLIEAARRHRGKLRQRAVCIQKHIRGWLARITCHSLRRCRAVTMIQSIVRGFLARQQFILLLKRYRERFRCANCGALEPGGVYCKYCGRRRAMDEALPPLPAIPIIPQGQGSTGRCRPRTLTVCTSEVACKPSPPLQIVSPRGLAPRAKPHQPRPAAPTMSSLAAERTRQRAAALQTIARQHDTSSSPALVLHIQRLTKAAAATSR